MIFCTSGWRTTSRPLNSTISIPSTPGQHLAHVDQPRAFARRQVDLRDVAGDDGLGVEAQARQEHFHLLDRGVLRLVQNNEGVVEGAPAHIGQRGDLDRPVFQEGPHALGVDHFVERVVERPDVGIEFRGDVAGQKAELLAGLDRRGAPRSGA